MLCAKLISVFVIILCLVPKQLQVTSSSLQPSTADNGKTIFATDGINCHLFRSYYDAVKKNERRRLDNKRELYPISRDTCRTLCRPNCRKEKKRVCGEYAGMHANFSNKCELRRTACLNGQAFFKVPKSKCNLS